MEVLIYKYLALGVYLMPHFCQHCMPGCDCTQPAQAGIYTMVLCILKSLLSSLFLLSTTTSECATNPKPAQHTHLLENIALVYIT